MLHVLRVQAGLRNARRANECLFLYLSYFDYAMEHVAVLAFYKIISFFKRHSV